MFYVISLKKMNINIYFIILLCVWDTNCMIRIIVLLEKKKYENWVTMGIYKKIMNIVTL
jgi:hypothetical protein